MCIEPTIHKLKGDDPYIRDKDITNIADMIYANGEHIGQFYEKLPKRLVEEKELDVPSLLDTLSQCVDRDFRLSKSSNMENSKRGLLVLDCNQSGENTTRSLEGLADKIKNTGADQLDNAKVENLVLDGLQNAIPHAALQNRIGDLAGSASKGASLQGSRFKSAVTHLEEAVMSESPDVAALPAYKALVSDVRGAFAGHKNNDQHVDAMLNDMQTAKNTPLVPRNAVVRQDRWIPK